MPATKITWEIEVPIFRHPVILKQLIVALGLPFGLVAAVLVSTAGIQNRIYALYALGLIALALLLTVCLVYGLYGGRYAVTYVVDDRGVRYYTQARHAKRSRFLNSLTIIVGLLSKQPSVAGAGALAQQRQAGSISWHQVRRVRFDDSSKTVQVRSSYLDAITLFCNQNNYDQVLAIVRGKVQARA